MFNKKNDPLVESVKAVMKQNEVHRQAEAALNEELGISSKKALPHEYHAQYDALLEAKLNEKLTPEAKHLIRQAMGPPGTPKPPDIRKIIRIARSNPKNVEEEAYSRKQKKLAMLGNAAGHGGNPEEIDEPDLSAARKGHAHKVGLEEKKLTSAETSKKEELVKEMKKGDWSKRYGERGKKVMYATAAKMAKKLAEDQGDVKPGDVKPKADKSLAESIIDEIRENLEANLIAIHESGDDELFENYVNSLTEEELDILGLNEDWRSAAFGDNTSGGSLSNAGYRTPPSVAAAQARGARPQQQARPAPTSAARPAPSPTSAARPASTGQPSPTAPTSSKGMETTKISVPTAQYGKTGPVKTGIAPKLSMPTTAPEIPKPSPGQTQSPSLNVDVNVPEKLSMPTSAPKVNFPTKKEISASPQKQRIGSNYQDTASTKTPDVGMGLDSTNTTKSTPGSGDASMSLDNTKKQTTKPAQNVAAQGFDEETIPQIKESLESFLRNRFLKG